MYVGGAWLKSYWDTGCSEAFCGWQSLDSNAWLLLQVSKPWYLPCPLHYIFTNYFTIFCCTGCRI